MPLAPIVLFAYNRLWHTRRTLEALRANDLAAESELIIYSDGPKRPEDAAKVEALRDYLRGVEGFRKVSLVERDRNLGLARSIISGVTETVGRAGRIIVLEDDMVTSRHFLRYMNEALDLYEQEERVISIAAYIYPVDSELPATFFLRGADCWGWATWKRGWDLFEPDGRKLLEELTARRLTREFDHNGSFHYTRMLRRQIEGKNDSWAIRWYASAFLKDRLTLYPGISLLQNIGNDGEGTHSSKTGDFDVQVADQPVRLVKLAPEPDPAGAKAVERYFRTRLRSVTSILKRALAKVIPGL